MDKILLVAGREFRQRIRTRGFLISSILTPLILVAVGLFTGGDVTNAQQPTAVGQHAGERPDAPVGLVDQAELVQHVPDSLPAELLLQFATVEAADAALANEEIAAYYVIPPDYRETGAVRSVAAELPLLPPDTNWLDELLVSNLLITTREELRSVLRRPFHASRPEVVISRLDDAEPTEAVGPAESDGLNWLPFVVTIAIILPLFTSGGYLFQSLVQEKSSRVMEILLLSLRPDQLLTGKLLGLGALTLVQYAVWVAVILVAVLVTGTYLGPALSTVHISGPELPLILLYALGGYVLYAALMAGIGAMTPNIENNRTWVFLISLPMLIPIYLWTMIVAAPHGTLAVTLSLVPFSAPAAMLMRIAADSVPTWQIGVSLLLLVLTGTGLVRLMARLFRAQTLLSGEALSPGRLWRALSSA